MDDRKVCVSTLLVTFVLAMLILVLTRVTKAHDRHVSLSCLYQRSCQLMLLSLCLFLALFLHRCAACCQDSRITGNKIQIGESP
eukprot:3286297-Amphidinium_carterae.1